jgi:hypothetical protein
MKSPHSCERGSGAGGTEPETRRDALALRAARGLGGADLGARWAALSRSQTLIRASEAGGPGPSNVMRADRRAWAATGHWVASRRPTGGERQQDGRDVVIGVAANR